MKLVFFPLVIINTSVNRVVMFFMWLVALLSGNSLKDNHEEINDSINAIDIQLCQGKLGRKPNPLERSIRILLTTRVLPR